jgi:hypothetical protein
MGMSERRLDDEQVAELDIAVRTLERMFAGVLLLLMFVDSTGVFIHARPGWEPEVGQFMAGVNWSTAKRVLEEHSER